MNKLHVISITAMQVILVFLYIKHQSTLTNLNYAEQKYQNQRADLYKQKKDLENTHTIQKDLASIKDKAEKRGLKKINFSRINSLDAI